MQTPLERARSGAGPILVTGASGFVGSHVVAALKDAGVAAEMICGCDRAGRGGHGIGRAMDVTDRQTVFDVIDELCPTAIIHLAAVAMPAKARADARGAFEVNLHGSLNIADAALRHAPRARLLFAGSAEAYGLSAISAPQPMTEDTSLRPATTYGVTKAAAELALVQLAGEGLDVICFRAFNHTGPGQQADYVASAFARQAALISLCLAEPVFHVGNLAARRDFLDVRDVARAYVLALDMAEVTPDQRVMNIASGQAVSIEAILETLRGMVGRATRVEIDPARLRPIDVPEMAGDPARLHAATGWLPEHKLGATLQALFEDWRRMERP